MEPIVWHIALIMIKSLFNAGHNLIILDINYMKKIIEQAFEVFTLRRENKKLTEDLLTVNAQLEFMFRQKLLSLSSDDDSKPEK